MAVSEVAICNQALSWLGGNLIISLDDPSDEAKICKANYALLRDAVLEEREWTFAVKRLQPSRLQEVPVYGYSAAFQIPSDVIRVLTVSRAGPGVMAGGIATRNTGIGKEQLVDWQREGCHIVTNGVEAIFIRYLARVEDTTKFTAAFGQALAARIAMDIAIPLTNSRLLQKDMAAMYGEKIALAAASDGMQGRSRRTRSNSLTRVR